MDTSDEVPPAIEAGPVAGGGDVDARQEAGESSKAARRREIARLQEALQSRLGRIESGLTLDVAELSRRGGSAEQFALDVLREAQRLGARIWRAVAGPSETAARFVHALAAPRTDDLGVDERMRETLFDGARAVARAWLGLRIEVQAPLPRRGGVLLACNRSSWPFPAEAVFLASALAERARRADVFVLWERAIVGAPGFGALLRRVGVVPAEPARVRPLLKRGAMVVAFPEGSAARTRAYADRYELAPFADGFMITEARDAGARVFPAAVVGPEESWPVLGRIAGIPLTPLFPWAGPAGTLPLPMHWRVRTGDPVSLDDEAGSGDPAVLVAARLRTLLGGLLAERRSLVRG